MSEEISPTISNIETTAETKEAVVLNPETTATVDPGYSAFIENQKLMNQIIGFMKDAPLESEKPKDLKPLLKVEFPVIGGILTYMEGQEYPYKGFPYFDFVDRIDTLKKLGRAMLSGIYHSFEGWRRLWLIFLIPTVRQMVWVGIYAYHRFVERYKIKVLLHCPAVQELHRSFSVEDGNERVKYQTARFMLRDVICMFLEFDNAYRYRFQDIVVELRKENLKKQPIKELNRLLEIMQTREKSQEIFDTWTLAKLGINLYLRLDRKMLKMIQNALLELDLDKIKLDEADKSYCVPRKDYTFGFMEQNVSK
jgi:hypothetical protein